MAAPKGNQFWKARAKHGRDLIFKNPETLWKACVEYFEWVDANPLMEDKGERVGEVKKMRAMTLSGLSIFLNLGEKTWSEYRERKDFLRVTTRAERIIRTQKFEGAAADLLNANIIARDLGLADKTEVKASVATTTIDWSKVSKKTKREILAAMKAAGREVDA